MEDLSSIIAIVTLIFGILQIILFFKIWTMTNHVRDIKEGVQSKDFIQEARVEYLKGNKEKANELLDKAFYDALIFYCLNDLEHSYRTRSHEKCVDLFRVGYRNMGFKMPDVDVDTIIKLSLWDKEIVSNNDMEK